MSLYSGDCGSSACKQGRRWCRRVAWDQIWALVPHNPDVLTPEVNRFSACVLPCKKELLSWGLQVPFGPGLSFQILTPEMYHSGAMQCIWLGIEMAQTHPRAQFHTASPAATFPVIASPCSPKFRHRVTGHLKTWRLCSGKISSSLTHPVQPSRSAPRWRWYPALPWHPRHLSSCVTKISFQCTQAQPIISQALTWVCGWIQGPGNRTCGFFLVFVSY